MSKLEDIVKNSISGMVDVALLDKLVPKIVKGLIENGVIVPPCKVGDIVQVWSKTLPTSEIDTADVEEVKHGEWIYNTDDFTPKMRCSVCGYNKPIAAGENIEQQPSDYCNKCGAKMDGERK